MEAHYPDTQLQLYGTQDEMMLDLTAGRLDAVMASGIALDAGFLETPAGEGYAFLGGDHYDPAVHGTGAARRTPRCATA